MQMEMNNFLPVFQGEGNNWESFFKLTTEYLKFLWVFEYVHLSILQLKTEVWTRMWFQMHPRMSKMTTCNAKNECAVKLPFQREWQLLAGTEKETRDRISPFWDMCPMLYFLPCRRTLLRIASDESLSCGARLGGEIVRLMLEIRGITLDKTDKFHYLH